MDTVNIDNSVDQPNAATNEHCISALSDTSSSTVSLTSTHSRRSNSAELPGIHHPNHQPIRPNPPLHFFGLVLSTLPPPGTAPSRIHPRVSPLPLSLGLDIDLASKSPIVTLVHALRTNPFDAAQGQELLTLTDPTSQLYMCPSLLHDSNLYFLSPSYTAGPFLAEVLEKLEEEGLVERTGETVETGAEEYRIMVDMGNMSKKCGWCERWEAVVRRKSTGCWREAAKYRRWKTCSGCGLKWFCRVECQKMAWDNYHWRECLDAQARKRMRDQREREMADAEGGEMEREDEEDGVGEEEEEEDNGVEEVFYETEAEGK